MAKGTTAAELRSKSDDELIELVKTTKSQLFEARFQNYTNRLNDTAKIGKLRRELARVNTVLNERRRAAQTQTASAARSEG
jgi:large subunit ribosomal protein L29